MNFREKVKELLKNTKPPFPLPERKIEKKNSRTYCRKNILVI